MGFSAKKVGEEQTNDLISDFLAKQASQIICKAQKTHAWAQQNF